MKRIVSLAIAALFIAAALASCASVSATVSPNAHIRMTSSDAADAAAWLDERLGERLTDAVVLGTNARDYGADLSSLEDDGYIIRSLGGEYVLFAKTTDGLDRAVRRYAKAVESGAAIGDVTYHEGYRIKRIELAGRDVSAYTIYCADDKYMPAAAEQFAARIAEANGTQLSVSTDTPAAPYIEIRYVHDDSLSTCGYRWSVDEGGLTIECSDGYTPHSAEQALTRFLEMRLGWFGLSYGYEALEAADLVSIAVGESGGEVNAFDFAELYGDSWSAPDTFDHDYTHMKLSGVSCCCHGLQNNRFAAELSKSPNQDWAGDQPCYLSDEFFEAAYDDISAYIEAKVAAGAVIGEDFCFVDIAAGDNKAWCECNKCRRLVALEGSKSAFIIDWANRITDALDEVYPGLIYGVFAYLGTNKPPKTLVPNEHVSVTYCFNSHCAMHTHDLKNCDGHIKENISYLEDWLAITDNVYVWYYGMDQSFLSVTYVGTVRDDLIYYHDIGVKGIMWEAEDNAYSTGKVSKWLAAGLVWDIDMTDEEYAAYRERILCALYGDGADYVGEYCDALAAIHRNFKCAASGYTAVASPNFASKFIAASFETLYALTETALRSVDDARQERRMTKLSVACIYQGCVASYFDAYEAGDDARVAELSRRYELIETRLAKYDIVLGRWWQYGVVVWDYEPYESDMEVMAWTSWRNNASALSLTLPTRGMPERVEKILAEREG